MKLDRIIEKRLFFWKCTSKECDFETEAEDAPAQPDECEKCGTPDLEMDSDYFQVHGDNF